MPSSRPPNLEPAPDLQPEPASTGPGLETGGLSEWVERLSDRLRSEFSLLLHALPPAVRTPAAVTRHLKLKGPICFRLMGALRSTGAPAEFFAAIPGPEGLERVLSAAKRAGVPAERTSAALAAIMDFEALIQQAGGSQRRLVAMLEDQRPQAPSQEASTLSRTPGSRPGPSNSSGLSASDERRGVFEHMSSLLRCRSRGLAAVRVCTVPEDGLEFDVLGVLGRVGFERHSQALPMVVRHGQARPGEPGAAASAPDPLLVEFCSAPIPPATMEQRDETNMYIIDPDNQRPGPMDLFIGPLPARYTMWRNLAGRGLNVAMGVGAPAEWLVFDTYVSRGFAERCQASAGAYLSGAVFPIVGDPRERWFDRFPGTVAPTMLGPGLANAECDRYPRQAELAARAFAAAGKDPAGYVGYRVVVEYPIINIIYLISLREGDAAAD